MAILDSSFESEEDVSRPLYIVKTLDVFLHHAMLRYKKYYI